MSEFNVSKPVVLTLRPSSIFMLIPTNTLFLTEVEFDPGCEAMVYAVDGTPLQVRF